MPASEIIPQRGRNPGSGALPAQSARSPAPKTLVSVQAMRGLAALAIIVLHAMADAGGIAGARGVGFPQPYDGLAAGVDLFFVISGLVMVYASRDMFGKPRAALVFAKRRGIRVIPLYWLATTLFLVILFYFQSALNSPRPTLAETLKSYAFIPYLNQLGDLQPILKLGWTLNYELFFYAIFCCVLSLTVRRGVVALTAIIGGLVLAGFMPVAKCAPILFWTDPIMLEFVFGAWIGLALVGGRRLPPTVAVIVFAAGLIVLCGFPPRILPRTLACGLPAAGLLASLALTGGNRGVPALLARGIVLFGDCSYALYLFHPFSLRFFHLAWMRTNALTRFGPWTYMLAASAVAISAAAVMHLVVERPFTRWLRNRLGVGGRIVRRGDLLD